MIYAQELYNQTVGSYDNIRVWEERLKTKALAAGFETPMNAFRPQSNFRYPNFPGLPEDLGDPYASFKRLAFPDHPENVHLYPTLTQAIQNWIEKLNLQGKTLLIQKPSAPEFLEVAATLKCPIAWVSRDPDEWLEAPWLTAGAFLCSQPSRADGFFYPQGNLDKLIIEIRRMRPDLPVLSEQSSSLFSLNAIPPGSLPHGKNNFIVKTLWPVWSPQGRPVSWIYGYDALPTESIERTSVSEVTEALQTLLTFHTRQGAAFGEFERKILLVQKGLRMFTDALKPVTIPRLCKIPLWPESGFSLLLDVAPILKKRGQNIEEFCTRLAEKEGILLAPGTLVGEPQQALLCYAAVPKWLEDLGKRLSESFSKDS